MGKSSQQYNVAREHQRSLHGVYGAPLNDKAGAYAFVDDDDDAASATPTAMRGWFRFRGAAANTAVLLTWLVFTVIAVVRGGSGKRVSSFPLPRLTRASRFC